MNDEKIYNLYLFIYKQKLSYLGCISYDVDYSDDDKRLLFLKERSILDYKRSKKYKLPKEFFGMNIEDYTAYERLGTHWIIFESILKIVNARIDPFICITIIADGYPKIDLVKDHKPFYLGNYKDSSLTGDGIMVDYLEKYTVNGELQIKKLINDDYFHAIKLLIENGYLVSAIKLILSFIDTISFIEYGDEGNVFVKWLKNYSKIDQIDVSAEELWELRNSILHMTNLDSRKHKNNEVKRVTFYMSKQNYWKPKFDQGLKHVHLLSFLDMLDTAVDVWIQTYKNSTNKMANFVKRYDRTISDLRISKIRV